MKDSSGDPLGINEGLNGITLVCRDSAGRITALYLKPKKARKLAKRLKRWADSVDPK